MSDDRCDLLCLDLTTAERLRRFRPGVDPLEERTLLTSNVFLDFGDNFPAGGLVMTVQQLRNGFGAAPAGLQGAIRTACRGSPW